MVDTSQTVDNPHVGFCIEIDYAKNSPNPSRVFRAMSDLIDALQSIDETLIEPLPIKIQPILLLEDIEASSIKAWFAQKVEAALNSVDDDALKSGDHKKLIGSYLVKGKYATVDFCRKTTEIKSAKDIEALEKEIFQLGEDAYISQLLPTHQPVSRQRLLNDINKINNALEPLSGSDQVKFIDNDGRTTEFNLSLSIAPETIDEILTREIIPSRMTMILKVKRPDFLGDAKWEFRFDNRPFVAKVADEGWLAKYHAGKETLSPGDALKADVESVVKYGFEGDVVETQHTILEVIKVIRPERQDQAPLDLGSQ